MEELDGLKKSSDLIRVPADLSAAAIPRRSDPSIDPGASPIGSAAPSPRRPRHGPLSAGVRPDRSPLPRDDDLDGIERAALSFGLSIAVVPLIGLGLNYTPWGIRLVPVVVSLSVFTIALLAAAHLRRAMLPADDRFSVPFQKTLDSLKEEMTTDQTSRVDKILTIVLVIAIISSISALVYVIVTPKRGREVHRVLHIGARGMAYDYPTSVASGENSTVMRSGDSQPRIPAREFTQSSFSST